MKKRSKVIKDLIMDKINVLQALESLSFMLEDIDSEEIIKWVNSELSGYSSEEDVPDYRKVNAILIGDLQVGYAVYSNVNIPIVDKEALELFGSAKITSPVSTIMHMSKAEEQIEDHCLCMEANTVLVNHYKVSNGTVIRAHSKLSMYSYSNMLAKIKDKLLIIFKELEINYGNLDDLYIDFSDIEKRNAVIEKIESIIYNDNSVIIGDNNVIKDSVVGDNNENR